ncbi:MAG: hypothetical protein J0I06_11920 [Planctomycetes bacterium]|nr:hypothetical protein [Planctomycetota bacterium]
MRKYPTNEVLGFRFEVSDSPAAPVPVAGRDTVRMPAPGVARRKPLSARRNDRPGRAVVIDSFEQRAPRPKRRPLAHDSGQKKARTPKSQIAVDEHSGRVVNVSDSAPGRWADIKLKRVRLMMRRPDGVVGIGDQG